MLRDQVNELQIYNDVKQATTAISRHTHTFKYVTKKKNDALSKFMIPAIQKHCVDGFLTNYNAQMKTQANPKISETLAKMCSHVGIGGSSIPVCTTADEKVRVNFLSHRSTDDLSPSEDILIFPDFSKPFVLTTDASDKALGAVLLQVTDQGERPISFISKSLSKTEENYATNEKELLAIVWALNAFRNFIYGAKISIYTDHMPLTFAISPKNSNAKLKRWKSYVEGHDYEMFYKEGKTNVVADALSRVQMNSLTPTMLLFS